MKIKEVHGYQVLDSRGRPTVAAALVLEDGSRHTARVPSGASTGAHEALELRDYGTDWEENFYSGRSVYMAVHNINHQIAPRLVGQSTDLYEVDKLLIDIDGSGDRHQLGANAVLAVSLCAALASAHSEKLSLARYFQPTGQLRVPMPMVNILSGGAHANRALDIQDILVIPVGASSFKESLSWVYAIRELAASYGAKLGHITHLVADEGGLGIHFPTIEHACEFVVKVIEQVGLSPNSQVNLALDVAATQFYHEGTYHLETSNHSFSTSQFRSYLLSLTTNFPICSIEDPFAEDDWQGWCDFLAEANPHLQIIGDDLLTTNDDRLSQAISKKAANAILIKANQNGLVTNTLEVLRQAQDANFATVVSARSGETEDSWLSDLAVGWNAGQIKVGSTHGSERAAKWNRLLELEEFEDTHFVNPFKS